MSGALSRGERVSYTSLLSDKRMLLIMSMTFIAVSGGNIVPPALPALGTDLQLSDARLGIIMAAYTLPAILITPVIGTLADMYGRRIVVLPSLLLFGVSGTAIAFVSHFELIITFRVLQGIAFAGIMPLTITLIGDFYRGQTGSAAQGFRSSANGINQLIMFPVAGFLAGFLWRYAFLLYSLSFVVFVLVYLYLPEVEFERSVDLSLGLGWISRNGLARWYANSREIMDLRTSTLVFGGFARLFIIFGIITFLPLFAVRELGVTSAAAGSVLALLSLKIIVSPFANQMLKVANRRMALVILFGFTAVVVAIFPFSPSVLWLAGLLFVWAVGDAILGPILSDAVANSVAESYRARVVSLFQVSKNLGKTAAPVLLGIVLAVGGFQALFMAVSFTGVVYVGLLVVSLVR